MYTPNWLVKFAQHIAGTIVISSEVGTTIQMYRKKYGMAQRQVADLLNLRRETISRIERGVTNPTIHFVQSLTGVLTMIEAIRASMAHSHEIEFPLLKRIAREFGIQPEKVDMILSIALESKTIEQGEV